ncbi:MAG: DUF4433 domain-containing protein [Alphaproteobacteria bacterium]|nr:DUF4433 domain-containing protein [Alphaproteobacteria bacterium]MBF0391802.1 DUF4433 domain-containing protein [Alphaproteobacteria bacterium]
MSISQAAIQAHVSHWEGQLGQGAYPYRSAWPSRVFRHEPVQNAADILRSGVLLSRTAASERNAISDDIAPEEIISATGRAHKYARLYFRPRNPTQYHIEGIKKPEEIYLGKHAPVLVIFVFRSSSVLSRKDVEFSDGNMQRAGTRLFSGDDDFENLPFSDIYHEGPFPADSRDLFIWRRCAEVLVPNELPLAGNLQSVLCRSSAERAFLLSLLGDAGEIWKARIRVFSKPGIFQSEYAYLERVQCSSSKIEFSFHPRKDGKSVLTEIDVHNEYGTLIFRKDPISLDTAIRWYTNPEMPDGRYIVSIRLEGCMAYQAPCVIDNMPF